MPNTSKLGTLDSVLSLSFATGVSDPGNTFVRNITQTMLSDMVEQETVFKLAANRVFYFGALGPSGQEATHNYVYGDVSNSFVFATESGYNQEVSITQYLGFTPRFIAPDLGNFFGFSGGGNGLTQFVGRVTTESVADTMLADSLTRAYAATNSMLTDTVAAVYQDDIYNRFNLTDLIDSLGSTIDRNPTHSVIKQSVSFTIQGADCPDKSYSPFIGSSDDATYPEVSPTPPTLTTGTLTLTYPQVAPTLTLVLKNPEFGNTDSLSFTKIDRKTRGGDRKIFSDTKWPNSQVFEITMVNICETTTVDAIVTFLNSSLGKLVGLLDWEGRNWKGVILTPNTDISEEVGGHRLTLVFQGELV